MTRAAPLFAALSVALAAGAPPSEIRLLPAGRFRAADGSGRPEGIAEGWLLDDAAAARLVGQASARASDYVIDYEHQTLLSGKNGQPAPAAGWYKRLDWRPGDGLYAVGVRWVARAAALIAAGEYRYLSPVFSYDRAGRVLALGPAALTNNPGLDGLTDLSRAALSAYFPEEMPMKELLKALGLAETATEAEALVALASVKSAHQGELAALKAVAPDPAKYVEVATLTAVQGELSAARTELATIKAAQHAAEVDGVVAEALTAGKLTPATEGWAKNLGKADLAALKAFIEAAPVVVKPGDTQTGGKKPEGKPGDGTQLTADQVALCARLGISHEDFAAAAVTAKA
jgi:phage I-like protein